MTNSEPRANPRVSVVMTAYNDLRFIEAAVKSILVQTYAKFELIIVDDGTGRNDIFAGLAALDARIRIITCNQNIGTYAAANRGISNARGEIIARLDADDIAEPARLARLVAALDSDPELGLIGSWATYIFETGERHHVWQLPVADLEVRWRILFENPFCHSAVAFRRTCFDVVGGYISTMGPSGDHELWWNMLKICRAGNLPEPLTQYRLNSRGLMAANPPNWRQRTERLRRQSWERLGVDYEPQLIPHLVEFDKDEEISDRDMRERTYRTALMLLTRFLAAPQPMPRQKDVAVARQIKFRIAGRALADRSIGLVRLAQLWSLCWRLDRAVALTALVTLIAGELARLKKTFASWG